MKLFARPAAIVLMVWTPFFTNALGEDLVPRKETGDWSKPRHEFNWKSIEISVAKNELGETKTLSHKSGDPFREVPEKGAVLIGFDCIMTPFRKSPQTVRGIAPIFLTKDGQMTGTIRGAQKGQRSVVPVVAKPGYAIGKVTGQFDGVALRRIKVRFERVIGSHLDDKDVYESPWIGIYDRALVTEDTIDTLGNIPVGIAGGSGWGLDGLRIVFQAPN